MVIVFTLIILKVLFNVKNQKNKFKGLLSIEGKLHKDKRGFLRELVIENQLKKKFKFRIVSKSKKMY